MLLAAGGGTRLGGAASKPLTEFVGRPLIDWATDAMRASGLSPLVVVLGHLADEVRPRVPADFVAVENARWSEGIATSLRAGLDALRSQHDVVGAVVGLVDQPLVSAEAYRRVAAAYDAGARLAAATYEGRRANPVLVGREHWEAARSLTGDVGARQLMGRHPVTDVPCDGIAQPDDIDTDEDLIALEARWRSTTASG